ncbi:hypothetical protein KY359_04895 [Candidatus Woesearchaeota archaeon]|nr:hypothetical protein [Candidatus Woesearchaeota archaeon]
MDVVFPKDNEQEFIAIAEKLNIESLCFVYDRPKDIAEFQKHTKIRLSHAILCEPDDVKKYKGKYATIVKAPEDHTKLRHIIEKIRPDILYGLEFHRKKDFIHHRASGLNHVLATLAQQKGVAIAFGFSEIIAAKPQDRARFIGRMMQNIRFARKFKFRTVLASFAADPWHMRGKQELVSFFAGIGMNAADATDSLNRVGR